MKRIDHDFNQKPVVELVGFRPSISPRSVDDLNDIISMLQLADRKDALDELMLQGIKIILSNSRFSPATKISVHLQVNEKMPLHLSAQYGFTDDVPASCAKMPLENCECTRVSDIENILFLNLKRDKKLTECHSEQEHYCVPLRGKGRFLGVINFYVEQTYEYHEYDKRFFIALSEALSTVIVRRSSEETLLLEHIQLRQKIKQHTQDLQHELRVRRRTEAELRKSYDSLSKAGAEEQALGVLLALSLESLTVEEYLKQAIETLRTIVKWIGDFPKGGIFLYEESQESLRLVASYGFSDAIKHQCNSVAFGHCLCGQAAKEGELHFSTTCCEPDNTIPEQALMPSGHFAIPIMLGESSLGVLVVYLPYNYVRAEHDEIFLKRVADVLSMGITRRRFEKEVEYLKCHDRLTGLTNRQQFVSDLEEALIQSEQAGQMGAVLFIGLINFNKINESLGHRVGDRLLEQIASRLKTLQRKGDVVARVGGNEFIVMLPNEGGNVESVTQNTQLISERLRHSITSTYQIEGNALIIESNIGIAIFPAKDILASEVVQQAATAMRRAKEEGGNITRFFHPAMQDLVDQRYSIEQSLRSALDRQRMQLYFQPQLDSRGKLVGAEALLRCPDENGDMLRMDQCIQVAESTGLIVPIGEWVLCEACTMLEFWSQEGLSSSLEHLCVNISPKQFYQQNFVSLVKSILSEYDFDHRRLVFEITEGFLIDSKHEAIEIMQELKSIGIGFAIDDFGTGYSSLSYLAQLPLDILKIDRAFVTGVVNDSKQAVIVETLVAMANKLGFETISEGVETKDELEFLLEKGCECFQGYYYSRPMPADIFTNELHNRNHKGGKK